MTECRHGLSEDCPGCMQEATDAAFATCIMIVEEECGLDKKPAQGRDNYVHGKYDVGMAILDRIKCAQRNPDETRMRVPAQRAQVSQEALDWAAVEVGKIEDYKAANPDWEKQTRPAREVIAQRAPTPDLTKALTEFSDFINEPPQYEDKCMVRDYRHELARKWVPLLEQLLALTSTECGDGDV